MSMTGKEPADGEIGIDRKVAFLRRPAVYPGGVAAVSAIETHMSWVFLADGLAYKLKKPVHLPYVDFSSVEARRQDCEAEVTLNPRLAPTVYLGVVPLTLESNGELALEGRGSAVDWLVKMRRLPQDGMLDRLIAKGAVPAEGIRKLVVLLTRFYATAPAVDWPPGEYCLRLTQAVEENAAELLRPPYELPSDRIHAVTRAQSDFLGRAAGRFEERVRTGRVVEGHGDLRSEHVCLDPGPVVIDCLEFSRDFRLLDTADELAFLALECERLGDRELGERILSLYAAMSGDLPDPGLVDFYKCLRACLRAKIAVQHLQDPGVGDRGKWRGRTLEYLRLAAKYAGRLN